MAVMTLEEARAEEARAEEATKQAEWESREMFKGFTVATLRQAMDAVQSKDHWKNPWSAAVHHSAVGAVLASVEFFHADTAEIVGVQPITGYVLMRGNGYQA